MIFLDSLTFLQFLNAKLPIILPLNDLKGDFFLQKNNFVMNEKFSEQTLRCD